MNLMLSAVLWICKRQQNTDLKSTKDLRTLHLLDSILKLKFNLQPAIVRSDKINSGADSLKAPHQFSQLPNYI